MNTKNNIISKIKEQQRLWAERKGIKLDKDGYCCDRNKNFFQPLSSGTIRDLMTGDGAELGKDGQRGKIQAVHSSSAIACNFFDYWRGRDLSLLVQTFDLTGQFSGPAFEQKYPTGLKGKSPNIDVVLYRIDGFLFAIESKFTEPFQQSNTKGPLKPKYFHNKKALWEEVRLSGCQAMAEKLHSNPLQFKHLDAAQLLKHMLGLAKNRQNWVLCYLWYCPDDPIAKYHAEEVVQFTQGIGSDATKFSSLTYQELFKRISYLLGQEHSHYRSYLKDRYFSDTTT